MLHRKIEKCRICDNPELTTILNLGQQALTGFFPKTKEENVEVCPLELVKCHGGDQNCNLVQLSHDFDLNKLYGDHYGYRSGLNSSMVKHLGATVDTAVNRVTLENGDLVIDIGSNDCTLLKAYPNISIERVGVDPTGNKFREFYPESVHLIADFFPSKHVSDLFPNKKAKIITSLAMFYDLPHPMEFVKSIAENLAEDGIWVFEQSYLPAMLSMNSYDTICHEHLEYYSLKQIKFMMDKNDLKIIDVGFNDINGGSFVVTAAKRNSHFGENIELVNSILKTEEDLRLNSLTPYEEFADRVNQHKHDVKTFLQKAKAEGKKVIGYGASTKGNVLLQFCDLDEDELPYIAEVNSDKFGSYTPGTKIKIISETEAKEMRPDYFMVLPWHFRDFIIKKEKTYLESGGHLYFPLPKGEVI